MASKQSTDDLMAGIGDGKETYYRVEGSYPMRPFYQEEGDARIDQIAKRYGSNIDSSGVGFGMRDVTVRFRTFIEALAFAEECCTLGLDFVYDITWDDWTRNNVDDFVRLASSNDPDPRLLQ